MQEWAKRRWKELEGELGTFQHFGHSFTLYFSADEPEQDKNKRMRRTFRRKFEMACRGRRTWLTHWMLVYSPSVNEELQAFYCHGRAENCCVFFFFLKAGDSVNALAQASRRIPRRFVNEGPRL